MVYFTIHVTMRTENSDLKIQFTSLLIHVFLKICEVFSCLFFPILWECLYTSLQQRFFFSSSILCATFSLFLFWNSCKGYVGLLDDVQQVPQLLFTLLYSFFFLPLRPDRFSHLSSRSLSLSSACSYLLFNLS